MKNKFTVNSLKPFINVDGLKDEEVVERKQFIADIKLLPTEDRTVIATISTMDMDAEGDCIIPQGADLERFTKNPVIHINHDYRVESVVGKATELAISDKGIVAKIKLANTARAEDCWQLLKGGFVKANSIGFIIKEAFHKGTEEFDKYISEKKLSIDKGASRLITKFELLESSIVSLPCNPAALMQAISAKSINLSDETIKQLDLPKVIEVPKNTIITETTEITKVGDIEETKIVKIAPIIPITPIAPEIPKFIKVIRSGSWDKQDELKKYLDIKSGKIV